MSAVPQQLPDGQTEPEANSPSRLLALPIGLRRRMFLAAATIIFGLLVSLMVATLSKGGFDPVDALVTGLFAMTLPWAIVGFLNACVGFAVMRTARDPAYDVCELARPRHGLPVRSSTAIAVCIRDEDVPTVARNLEQMLTGLRSQGIAEHFHAYVLSDSSDDAVGRLEQRVFTELAARWADSIPLRYRRRAENVGFKAGNIREFVEQWGHQHDFMLVLDADSFMTADAIVRLVRVMEANPGVGILQSLVNGMPAASAFSRVFQFGMRLGMKSYTIGGAWWQGDCGPYWGHNALIRMTPFVEHCELPPIPGDGPLRGAILSHDQVEAVLMRRAGFEVRVLPDATGSYEENPPNLVEFVRRDLRWCLGNMQYLYLLGMPGLRVVSRVQLMLAILMFASSPAWLGFLGIGALRVGLAAEPTSTFDPTLGIVLFVSVMAMVLAPKLATLADLILDEDKRLSFGGLPRVATSVLSEIVFFSLLAPVMAIAHTRFIAGLPIGRKTTWAPQQRGALRLSAAEAWRRFWFQTLLGALALAWIVAMSTAFVWTFLPVALGPLLSVPFAVITGSGAAGLWLRRLRLWQVPEEIVTPPELEALFAAEQEAHLTHLGSATSRSTAIPNVSDGLPVQALVATSVE